MGKDANAEPHRPYQVNGVDNGASLDAVRVVDDMSYQPTARSEQQAQPFVKDLAVPMPTS